MYLILGVIGIAVVLYLLLSKMTYGFQLLLMQNNVFSICYLNSIDEYLWTNSCSDILRCWSCHTSFFVLFLYYFHCSILRQLYPKKEVNELYLRAVELDEDRFSFEMQVVSVKCNVREIMKQTKHERALKIAQSVRSISKFHCRFWIVCQMMKKSA